MDYIMLMFMSMLPIIELKGAIPIGITSGLNPVLVYIVCVIGSTLISIPLIITFRSILKILKQNKLFYKVGNKIDRTINNRMKKLKSITIFGLMIFVGVSLPTTGSWTGSAIASILKMRIKDALIGVFLGNALCGAIVLVFMLYLT